MHESGLRVAVIGAGQHGAELVQLCLHAGYAVTVEDVFPDKLRSLRAILGDAAETGDLRFAVTVEDAVRHAEIALDSVPDELESKLEIFSLLDRMAPPRTILCSPLRDVSITDIASCTYRAERCAGFRMEPFGETWLDAPHVTLVRGRDTSEGTAATLTAFWQSLGKQVSCKLDDCAA